MENNPIAKAIGQKIRERRAAIRMPRTVLAKAIGTGNKSVWVWENGFGCPNVRYLRPLSIALGITVDELLGGAYES